MADGMGGMTECGVVDLRPKHIAPKKSLQLSVSLGVSANAALIARGLTGFPILFQNKFKILESRSLI